jgi:hypothetical protein
VEHIIPESLGNTEMILAEGVCRSCNNALSGVDRSLLKQFEIATFVLGVPRKGGRPATIDGWRGVRTHIQDGKPSLYVNAGPGAVITPAGPLKPTDRTSGLRALRWSKEPVIGQEHQINFEQEMRFDRKFTRGIYKCGFETLVRYVGTDVAQDGAFDAVRAFTRHHRGHLEALAIFRPQDDPREGVLTYYMESGNAAASAASFILFGIEFVCDFHPSQPYLRMLETKVADEDVGGKLRRIPYC